MTHEWTPPEKVDLQNCTRSADKVYSLILIEDDVGNRHSWLRFGEVKIQKTEHSSWVQARLTSGITDFEHDSAYAFRIPLIGIEWRPYVDYSRVEWSAWVDPRNHNDFRVPTGSYDPSTLPGSYSCLDCETPHLIIPEDHYSGPPFNADLWAKVRGRKIHIVSGPLSQ